ncbi:uracil-DNA glycosylase family protein [Cyclobacterium sp. 1_MG-2023]|uniref:uracil-DNA glycosylase family protein n=1 Tax=Cyclobacterium sp. 1_MG-2023 TaxID=3062681 RepID=UPI0026E1CC14|nr:uracil-DNA glycosylase family protein [Cyclobacterium sp. 1_MG-2023]MDO6436641.1 uracil-DNA glycosylase family protein [Cyclobacterium sp. 1_MG-2023]
MEALLKEIRACTLCEKYLPLGPRPVLSAHANSKILIVGQAPGTKVHASGLPWDDVSGKNLRTWMDVDKDLFYNSEIFGIVPMGFCYPGRGKGGDLPPRPECAPKWHPDLMREMPKIQLVLLIGQYAQHYYLGKEKKKNLTETVRNYQDYLPKFFPLVHPSPRNRIWQMKNPWFEEEVVPALQLAVHALL